KPCRRVSAASSAPTKALPSCSCGAPTPQASTPHCKSTSPELSRESASYMSVAQRVIHAPRAPHECDCHHGHCQFHHRLLKKVRRRQPTPQLELTASTRNPPPRGNIPTVSSLQ